MKHFSFLIIFIFGVFSLLLFPEVFKEEVSGLSFIYCTKDSDCPKSEVWIKCPSGDFFSKYFICQNNTCIEKTLDLDIMSRPDRCGPKGECIEEKCLEISPRCGNNICEKGEGGIIECFCPSPLSGQPPCRAPCRIKPGSCPQDCPRIEKEECLACQVMDCKEGYQCICLDRMKGKCVEIFSSFEKESVKTEIRNEKKKKIPLSIEKVKEKQGRLKIKTEKSEATTLEKMIIKNSKLYLEVKPQTIKEIKVLPEEASSKAVEEIKLDRIEEMELKKEKEKPVYSVKGIRKAKLFFLIPVILKIEIKIDAQTNNILLVKKPWWSFLTWSL